jgi:DNA repair protein RecN (Recombination protein N)
MLDELVVDNLGLIAHAHVEPGPGLVAVTGETGAGKTLLLGALRLLRGDPAHRDRIGPSGGEARVEGRFVLGGDEVVVGRRLSASRSRAYLDGSMVPAGVLEERFGGLVEIVAQHEHVALGRETAVRRLVDSGLDDAGEAALAEYRAAWEHLGTLAAERDALGGDQRALERELDLVTHQTREIEAASPQPGEDSDLAATLQRLRHATEIAEALAAAHRALAEEDAAADRLGTAERLVARVATHDPSLEPLARRLAAASSEIAELVVDLRRAGDDIAFDPEALQTAEERLALLSSLRRKYGETLEEVIGFGRASASRAAELSRLLERADVLDEELEAAGAVANSAGASLRAARQRAAGRLAAEAGAHLRDLGFAAPVLQVAVEAGPLSASGADRIKLLFSSDEALEPGPVSRVASGGELSRLVLAVRLAGGITDAPIVAFDEIDAGVGGATALALGQKLAALASGRQVLVVTHLPQVAAFADAHLVVDREGSRAVVREVSGADRVAELTRMLGGLPESERGREHAEELVALAQSRRTP